MTVRELTGNMWYNQKVRLVTSADECFASVEDRTIFSGENMKFCSELNKGFLNYTVKSFGVIDGEIVVAV